MAIKTIEKGIIALNGALELPEAVACGSDGAVVEFDTEDRKILLIIGTAEATIKAGNGLQGTEDLTVEFTTGKQKAVVVESGRFVNTSGPNKGKILITGATATVQAVALP